MNRRISESDPQLARLLSERRKAAALMAEKAYRLRMENKREEAADMLEEALEDFPEEFSYDRAARAWMHYQAGLNYMHWRRLESCPSADAMNADQLEALSALRRHWTAMMEMATDLNAQEIASHDITPTGKSPMLANGIRAVVSDPLFKRTVKPEWLFWTRRNLAWPLNEDAFRGMKVPDTEVDYLISTAARITEDFPDDAEALKESLYSSRMQSMVIEPLIEYYYDSYDNYGADSDIESLSYEEIDLHLKGTLEGAILSLTAFKLGQGQMSHDAQVRLLSIGNDFSRYNRRFMLARYGESGTQASFAFRALADVSGHIMFNLAAVKAMPEAAGKAALIFSTYGNQQAVSASRQLEMQLKAH